MAASTLRPAQLSRIFLPFALGYFLSYLFRIVNGPIADRLIAEFHLDAESLGLLTAVYFLAFTLAQLPYGPLVDRYGPRRVQSTVLLIGAAGAIIFASAGNLATLMLGRTLIGLGTSGALMAGLKALAMWVPADRRTRVNGGFIMFGGLGAMASTVPVGLLQPPLGWRGIFLVLGAATAASALLVLTVVPEKPASVLAEDWRSSVRGLLGIYRDPAFWRLAPLSACVIGTAFAVHGLWAARWLTDVNGFAESSVTYLLLVMGGGLTIGAVVIGFTADRLRHNGVPPMVTFGIACTVFIGLQIALLGRLPVPAWLIWGIIGGFGGMTVLSYSIMGELFPPEKIGRANGALNVLHLSMAFILQYGMGVVASLWPAEPFGYLPFAAYRAAFAVPLLLELLALAWFAVSITQRRQASEVILPRPQPEVSC